MSRIDNADWTRIVSSIRDRFPVSGVATKAGVKLTRAGREWKGCCPFHPDKSPSFTIYADDRRFQCFGCGAEGDVLDFVQRAYGVKMREAISMLDGGALRELEQQRAPAKPKTDMRPIAQRIVRESSPIEGTPAAVYLRSRGIRIDLPHTLRFARLAPPKIEGNGVLEANGPGLLPTLVAIVTDATGELVGLQRTYLTDAGHKATTTDPKGKVKFSLGNVVGGSIQIGPPAASMLVCEGLEDGLPLTVGWVSRRRSKMSFIRMFPPSKPEPIPALPRGFNVRVAALEPAYAKVVRRGVEDGWLDGYTTAGELYVNQTDLFDLAGNGADTNDPHGGCYIPSWAKVAAPDE